MDISELITTDGVIARLSASSKKQALQELAKRAADLTGLQERTVFDVLLERERLGTTGVGNGIRSEEHTSELQSLMRISYAVICLNKKRQHTRTHHQRCTKYE